jgi:cobaltochelatase CobN
LLALLRVERGDGKGGNASLLRALARRWGWASTRSIATWPALAGPRPALLQQLTRRCGAPPAIPASASNCWR